MKHAEFIPKMEAAKAAHDCYERLKDWKLVGAELGLSVLIAGSRNAFYSRHRNDVIKPEWGHLSHDDVRAISPWAKMSVEELKAMLTRKISVKERIVEYWPNDDGLGRPAQHCIRLLLKSIADWSEGVDWFQHSDDKHYVHWKHNSKQEQAA